MVDQRVSEHLGLLTGSCVVYVPTDFVITSSRHLTVHIDGTRIGNIEFEPSMMSVGKAERMDKEGKQSFQESDRETQNIVGMQP